MDIQESKTYVYEENAKQKHNNTICKQFWFNQKKQRTKATFYTKYNTHVRILNFKNSVFRML